MSPDRVLHTAEMLDYMRRAVNIAGEAEADGNLPIGCILVYKDQVVAEAGNASLRPHFAPIRHAELEALGRLESQVRRNSVEITCYTTLEPCVMCFAALAIHGIGRVVFGARDPEGGGLLIAQHMPSVYVRLHRIPVMIGPVMDAECSELYRRARQRLIEARNG